MRVRDWALARLAEQDLLQVFDGAPDDAAPSIGWSPRPDGKGQRDVFHDGDGRAHQYACLYAAPGTRSREDERQNGLGGTTDNVFQVTAAGGDQRRCGLAVEKVLDALHGQRLPGGGICRADAFAPTPRIDRDPSPSRAYVPLIFRVASGDA